MTDTIKQRLARLEEWVEEVEQAGNEERECLNEQLIALKKRVADLERQVNTLVEPD